MRRTRSGIVTAVCALLIAPVSAFAHHGFAAEYDPTKCETLQGTLTGVDWHNPHVYFHVDVEDADGKVTSHALEANSTMAMNRSGTSRRDFLGNVRERRLRKGVSSQARWYAEQMGDDHARALGWRNALGWPGCRT